MDRINRRSAIASLALGATSTPLLGNPLPQGSSDEEERALAAGLNQEESRCWELLVEAANAYLALPELHPMDKREVASAIHGVQYKLLARPTYRKYLELERSNSSEDEN